MVALEAIRPSPFQPRKVFDPAALEELAASIRRHGLQQPIVVRPVGEGYELIAGERRVRAARLAGLTQVPALVRPCSDPEARELCLIENLQRRDLTPMEEARAYGQLLAEGRTLSEIATMVKRTVAWVEFRARLLNLRPEYQDAVERGILPLPQACDLARLPRDRQPEVWRLIRTGVDGNRVARVITAILEEGRQMELTPAEAAQAREVAARFERLLKTMAKQVGSCYSKRDLTLLGWVLDGPIETNLARLELIIKQLRSMAEALRRARARRDLRRGAVDGEGS